MFYPDRAGYYVRWLSGAIIVYVLVLIFPLSSSFAWHDETHLAVAKAAGYHKWYGAVGADMAKIKAGSIESLNHFFDNPQGMQVTRKLVMEQAELYNDPRDRVGHLYGAIMASLKKYQTKKKYGEYHLAYAAHYITDLSQPLHNMPYDNFNRAHHTEFDATVEKEVLAHIDRIKKHMYRIMLRSGHFEEDLAGEVARIANLSRELGEKIKRQNRLMTEEEAYRQLGHSASLLRAVIEYFNGLSSGEKKIKKPASDNS
jgi:chorismate mutase